MDWKKLIGIAMLPTAFIFLTTSLPKAPKHISLPIGATILSLFGYYEGIAKIEKTGNPIKLLKELGAVMMFLLGVVIMIYAYKEYLPLWMMLLIPGFLALFLSRKLFLFEKEDKEESEEPEEVGVKGYIKKNLVPLTFLVFFLGSFAYSDNQLLLRVEALGFITLIIINRIYIA